jgi:hypothetical protein
MGLDRLDYAVTGVTAAGELSPKVQQFLEELTLETRTGFRTQDAILLPARVGITNG